MLQCFFEGWSLCSVLFKKSLHYIFGVVAYSVPWLKGEVWCILNCLSGYFLVFFVVKWEYSTQEEVDDNAETPEIDFFAVGFLQQHFWSYITQGTKWVQAAFIWSNNFGKTKIYNFEICIISVGGHENIFWF